MTLNAPDPNIGSPRLRDGWMRDHIVAVAYAELGATDPVPYLRKAAPAYAPNDRPSWCGIWVRWVWLSSGLVVPEWEIGESNLDNLERTDDPEPGDLTQWRGPKGHQSLFRYRRDGKIFSLDANTIGTDREGKWSAACVAECERSEREVLAFYRAPIHSVNVDEGHSPR